MDDLASLLAEHMAMEFPPSVEKGDDDGEVCPVMIGADIFTGSEDQYSTAT